MELTLQEYRVIVENSPTLIWRAGLDAKCNYFNKTWLVFTGRTLEQEQGDGWAKGVYPDDLDRCIKTYLEAFQEHRPFEMEYRLRRHDEEWRWINDRGMPFFTEDGTFAGYIGSCMDVTDEVEGYLYKEQAQKDSLTGALSRPYLLNQMQRCFEYAKIHETKLTFAMLDIDQFKQINDIYGHLIGDNALKLFVSVVKHIIRENDLLGRYGGDEFVVVFTNADIQESEAVIRRINEGLKSLAMKTTGDDIILGMSYGLCELGVRTSVEEMLHTADLEMYEQKKQKRSTDNRNTTIPKK